jgi:hypothetical protein
MLSYDTDGIILTLTAAGTVTLAERHHVFREVSSDPRVPNRALVLLDVHGVEAAVNEAAVVERVQALREQLGPKLGPACAMIVGTELESNARVFRETAIGSGLHIGIFSAKESARNWLMSYRAANILDH